MGLIRYHGRAVRLNGLTDGLVVPSGRFKESGRDLRHPAFTTTPKTPKSDAAKVGRRHEEAISNPLNSIRGAFTIDAYIIPDYGGVVLDKPGQFKLTYGNPFSAGPIVFDVTTDTRTYRLESTFNAPAITQNNSGAYSGGEHKPHDLTLGEQPLILITAQFSRQYIRLFINANLIAELNLGGEAPLVSEKSSDLFIGGQGGEYRGLIESIRLNRGIVQPKLEPLTNMDTTLGLWLFDDDFETPDIRFFDNARAAVTNQGRDGPDTHDGLMPLPMVAVGHTFSGATFKIRDYPLNPNTSVDRYTALEKLAAYLTGVALKDVKNQTWYASGTLDLTEADYFSGVASTSLNAIINHSGTHPLTGISSSPASEMIRWSDDVATASSAAVDMNPMSLLPERVRITAIDFTASTLTCTSIHLANDEQNNGVDNLPETQNPLFTRNTDALVWFVIGKSDVLIDPGNENTHASVNNQKTRAKDTFTKFLFNQNQRFSDLTEFNNDAYFLSPKSRSLGTNSATVLATPAETYPAMGGVTAYTLYEGDFFIKRLPPPDGQIVRQTVQGISNAFQYETDDLSLGTILNHNDTVKVTETVFNGMIRGVINTSSSVLATDASGNPFNRIVTESGVGAYSSNNFSASTRDEIVAIAVADVKPFLLKGLDADYTAQLSGGVPTNDGYIRHLTPERKSRIAVIKSPAALVSAGGPSKVLVHYNAIDLTGEVVAGTGFSLRSGINTKFVPFHAIGNTGYLVVSKTVPCGSAVFGAKTLSEWLRTPYSSAPTNHKEILMKITAPGGLLSLPTASFNGPMASNVLAASPTGDITPSPFINIEDCVVTIGTGIRGYGLPKAIPSTNTPDDTSNSEYHTLFIESGQKTNLTNYTGATQTPAALRRSNLMGFDVIDNDLKTEESYVLVHPSKRSRYATLDDILMTTDGGDNASSASIELNLMKGRIEEIAPTSSAEGATTKLVLRGRSILMDISDSRATRDFNLSQGSLIKEIGDLGTPSVSLTLGGLGQGGVDIQPSYIEHPLFPGWKDRIVGSGNASVRNDKQTSTYYASTRALVELPLFPSMFFDVKSIENSDNDSRSPLSATKSFTMTVDTTMTAVNRPQMKEFENRYTIDWGLADDVASVEVTNQYWDFLMSEEGKWIIRCQRPSVQGVVTAWNNSTKAITLDDNSSFGKDGGERGDAGYCEDTEIWVTIGEGLPIINDGYGVLVRCNVTPSNTLTVTSPVNASVFHPLTLDAQDLNTKIFNGATVVLGGFINLGNGENTSEASVTADFIANISTVTTNYHSAHGDPSGAYEFSKLAPLFASEIATCARKLHGKTSPAVQADPNNPNRYLIKDGPNMESFDWDITELQESSADRYIQPPILCKCSQVALKGKKSDGANLEYVRPLEIDFNDIAVKMGDFNLCVDEVIRRINMAGHPQAKNSVGGSAFDPPPLFVTSNTDTGTHMGYVRAFLGTDTESRDGEKGASIVIHSTIPGATGRNFCIHLNNNTPYAYKPTKVVGYGGLSATNSRVYHPNSFPAPLPIGIDGETFVPISTFRGAPHGSIHDADGNVRSYDGLGSIFKVKTIHTPIVKVLADGTDSSTYNGFMVRPPTLAAAKSAGKIDALAVSLKTEDWLKRISALTSSTDRGVIRINNKLADFDAISQSLGNDIAENCLYIQNIYPRGDMDSFYGQFFDGTPATDTEIGDIDVEIIWPGIDTQGIVFFGGGHTGVVLDVSDGTANDYSDDYKHPYSKGPTGFSGYQNLHEVSTASAVLDFTDITNNDTINENTLQGIHHKLRVNSSGVIEDGCRFYARLNQTIAAGTHSQSNALLTEDLYGSPLRVTGTGANFTLTNGPAFSVDATDKGMLFGNGQAVALYNYNSGVENEYGPMTDFDCRGDFTISAWFKCSNATTSGEPASGPIITGIDSGGRFWGLIMAGGDDANHGANDQYVNFGLIACEADGTQIVFFNDITKLGLRVDRDAWSNIVVSKSGSTVSFYLANESYLKFGKSGHHGGEASLTGMQNIGTLSDVTDYPSTPINGSVRKTTDSGHQPSQVVAQAIPSALGTTAATGMTLIGLSALRDIANSTNNGANYTLTNQYQGTYSAPTSSSAIIVYAGTTDGSGGVNNPMQNSGTHYLWNCYLSNVAVFNHALSSAEAAEIWAAKGVW